MKRLSPFTFLIGIGLFLLLLRLVDIPTTLQLLRNADPRWLALAFLMALPELLFKSARLFGLAKKLGSHLNFKDSLQISLSGQPLSAVTPGKLGDVVRVFGLSKIGKLSLPEAFAAHVADKVYDLLSLALLASIGTINLIITAQNQMPALAALLGLLVGIVLISLFLHPQWVRNYIKPLLLSLAPKKLTANIQEHGREFYQRLQELFTVRSLAWPFLFSFLAWESNALRAFFCVLALGLPISLMSLVLLVPLVTVIELLPISIMGFGTREAALFFLFTSGLVDRSALLSFSLLTVIVGPLFLALLGIPAAMRLSSLVTKKP